MFALKTGEKDETPKKAFDDVNNAKLQISFHQYQLNSLNFLSPSENWLISVQKESNASIPEDQKVQDPTPFISSPLFSTDPTGQPYLDGSNNETKSPVYFEIWRYNALGSHEVRQYGRARWFSRPLAPNYTVEYEQKIRLEDSKTIVPLITSAIFVDAGWYVVEDNKTLETLHDGFNKYLENYVTSMASGTQLLKQVGKITFDFLKPNEFNASDPLSQAKSSLSEEQRRLISANLHFIMNGGKVIGYADHSGICGDYEYKKNWKKADENIRNSNIGLAWNNGKYASEILGVPHSLALYYDSHLLLSPEGREIICKQIDWHIQALKDVFIDNNLGAYPSNMQEQIKEAQNSVNAAASSRGVDAKESVQEVIEELKRIKGLISSNDPSAAKEFFDFKLKYAIVRDPEKAAQKIQEKSEDPEKIGERYGGKGWIQKGLVPGYLAASFALDFVGRGVIFIPNTEKILDIRYNVVKEESMPKMGPDAGKDFQPYEGYARVLWHVTVKKESTAQEYPEVFKKRLVELARQANSVWNPQTKKFELKEGIVVEDNVDFKRLPNGDREYVVEIRNLYSVKTHEDVESLDKKISIPSAIVFGSTPLVVYEMTAYLPPAIPEPPGKKEPPQKEPPLFYLTLGQSIMPHFGTKMSLFKADKSVDESQVGLFGYRDDSTGGFMDLFTAIGSPLKSWDDYRRLTYFWDRQRNSYRFMGSGLLSFPLMEACGVKEVKGKDSQGNEITYYYLKDISLQNLRKAFDENADKIIKRLYTPGLAEQLPQDPYLKDKPYDFLDSLEKIKEFSPLAYAQTRTQLWLGFLRQARLMADPNDKEKIEWLDSEIRKAAGEAISEPANVLFPSYLSGARAWGLVSDMIARLGESARDHGLTASFWLNPSHRLMVTYSFPTGSSLGQGITLFNPSFPLTMQLQNVSMFVLNDQINLFKLENDRTLFNVDFVSEVGLLWTKNPRFFEYNKDVWGPWSIIQNQFDAPVEDRNAVIINNAAKYLRAKLLPSDDEGRKICDDIIRYSDPDNPEADVHVGDNTNITGKWASAVTRMSWHLSSPMYMGGGLTETNLLVGFYHSPKQDKNFMSRDNLYFGTNILGLDAIPFGHLRFDYRFREKDVSFGILPKSAALTLDITGSLFLPAGFYSIFARSFSGKDSVFRHAIDGMPQITNNLIPPLFFNATVSRMIPLMTDIASEIGINLSGNATAFSLTSAKLFITGESGFIPHTNTRLKVEAGYTGTGLGDMHPTFGATLETYTVKLPLLGDNAKLGAYAHYLFSQLDWGRVTHVGVGLQFTYFFGKPKAGAIPDIGTIYSPLDWNKFGDPNAWKKKAEEVFNGYNAKNPTPTPENIEFKKESEPIVPTQPVILEESKEPVPEAPAKQPPKESSRKDKENQEKKKAAPAKEPSKEDKKEKKKEPEAEEEEATPLPD